MMDDLELARPLEEELRNLFGETTCHLERKSCGGKYAGHTDYTLVFGSGRRLYIGLDKRNYLNSLWDRLRAMRHFRAHQAENSERIQAALLAHDTPFCKAEVEILPYEGTSDLTLYAVVVLSTDRGVRFVYRNPMMHGFLVGYDGLPFDFDFCMKELLHDVRRAMWNTHLLADKTAA